MVRLPIPPENSAQNTLNLRTPIGLNPWTFYILLVDVYHTAARISEDVIGNTKSFLEFIHED